MNFRAALFVVFYVAVAFSAFGQKTVQSTPLENVPEVKGNAAKVRREVFDAAKNPALAAVGRINFLGGTWCSIILVSEDIAVTAGHCFLKANFKYDLTKDLDSFRTSVNFKPDGVRRIEGISAQRVLKARLNPDYAIVRLNKKISADVIKPLSISKLSIKEMRAVEAHLGCAGFNGDKELGSGGFLLTISRNVRIIQENSTKKLINTNCFSTYGGSGGLFFRENLVAENNPPQIDFLGVIWGVIDEKLNEKGKLVKNDDVVTLITPVSVFYDELTAIIEKDEKLKNGEIRAENKKN